MGIKEDLREGKGGWVLNFEEKKWKKLKKCSKFHIIRTIAKRSKSRRKMEMD